MADVFISYAREDRPWAAQLRDALVTRGLDVWWDDNLSSGQAFANELEERLNQSKAVIVLWSRSSVGSTFVRDEAGMARDMEKLIPVSIDGVKPPLGFGQFHTSDLDGWNGDAASADLKKLANRVGELAGVEIQQRVKGGARTWLKLSDDDARRHPLYGFSGALLAIYLGWLLVISTQVFIATQTRDQLRMQQEAGTLPVFNPDMMIGWADQVTYSETVAMGWFVQAALCLPFMLLPLLRFWWTPFLAAAGVLAGQLLWPLYWLPAVQPVSTYLIQQITPMMIAAGIAAFLVSSDRVRVTYARQVRNVLLR